MKELITWFVIKTGINRICKFKVKLTEKEFDEILKAIFNEWKDMSSEELLIKADKQFANIKYIEESPNSKVTIYNVCRDKKVDLEKNKFRVMVEVD